MGTLIGHVAPGIGFLLIGLWHLLNTIRNYAEQGPWGFETKPWFPAGAAGKRRRRLELYAIMGGALLSIAAELFIGPRRHQPFGPNLSIPPEHLNNFEHSTISLFLFLYAATAAAEDAGKIRLPDGALHFLAATAFAMELLIFHLHSSDHMGLEGHYHWLLQLVVGASLAATVGEMGAPRSLWLATGRAASVALQGVWLVQMGMVLWVPRFMPTGCRLEEEEYHSVVRCEDEGATHRAKAMATLQFAWYVAGIMAMVVGVMAAALRREEGIRVNVGAAGAFQGIRYNRQSAAASAEEEGARAEEAEEEEEQGGKLRKLELSSSSGASSVDGTAHSVVDEERLPMINIHLGR